MIRDGQKIVFLGDSITQAADGYVSVVEHMLGALVPGARVECVNAGIGGNKVTDMLARVDDDVISHCPGWVTVSVGINDVWHGPAGVPVELFRGKYEELVSRLAEHGSARLALFTTTVIGEDLRSEANQKLVPYNEFIRDTARRKNALLVDMNEAFRAAIAAWEAVGEGLRFTTDGVHMTPVGNCLMALTLLRAWELL